MLFICKAPGTVVNVSVTTLSSTQIKVTWKEPSQPNGIIFLYFVNYKELMGDKINKRRDEMKVNVVEVLGNTTVTTVKELKPFTKYSLSVTAVNKDDGKLLIGQTSQSVTVKTLEDGMSLRSSYNFCDYVFIQKNRLLIAKKYTSQ